ncbi:4443_t:CDS:1 [Racocetra fulgida]|uniref:4443_t:CDS:1 n=1 Tax=Racocetra fulgida TaxID=60492 RepID=A0A9N9DCL8_9GLOM|nr:4443_t:CDS:1 [Racocetra fulgida]
MDSDYEARVKLCNRVIGNLLFSRTNGLKVLKIDRGEIEDSCLMNIVNLNDKISEKESNYNYYYEAFSELERFELKFDNDDEEKWTFNSEYKSQICSQLATYTRSLSHITISIDPFRRSPPPPLVVCRPIFELISSQDKLKFLDIEEFWDEFKYTDEFYFSLQSQAHSITHLTLTNLTEFDLLLSVLVSCVNLQTLEFLMVPEPNMESFDYITNPRKPLSVKKLISYDARSEPQLVTQSLGIIIKMANRNLRALMLFEVTSELIDIIGQNCPNLVDLYLTMSTSSISHLLPFLPSLPLEYLFLWEDHSMPFTLDFVLQIARSIPVTLQNLEITFDMAPEIMYNFLWECPAKFRELVLRVDGCDDEFLEIVTMYAKKRGGYLRTLKLWGLGIKFSVEAVEEAMKVIPRIVNLASYPLW